MSSWRRHRKCFCGSRFSTSFQQFAKKNKFQLHSATKVAVPRSSRGGGETEWMKSFPISFPFYLPFPFGLPFSLGCQPWKPWLTVVNLSSVWKRIGFPRSVALVGRVLRLLERPAGAALFIVPADTIITWWLRLRWHPCCLSGSLAPPCINIPNFASFFFLHDCLRQGRPL